MCVFVCERACVCVRACVRACVCVCAYLYSFFGFRSFEQNPLRQDLHGALEQQREHLVCYSILILSSCAHLLFPLSSPSLPVDSPRLLCYGTTCSEALRYTRDSQKSVRVCVGRGGCLGDIAARPGSRTEPS